MSTDTSVESWSICRPIHRSRGAQNTHDPVLFYSTWVKPVCCVSKISSDCRCQSKQIGVGMEGSCFIRWCQRFFSRRFATHSILSSPTRKNPLAPRVRGVVYAKVIEPQKISPCERRIRNSCTNYSRDESYRKEQ